MGNTADDVGLGRVGMYEGTKQSTLTEGRRRGLPLDRLQKAAGHKDSGSTEIYAELAQEQATRVLRMARTPAALEPRLKNDTMSYREIPIFEQIWKHPARGAFGI